VLAKENEGEAPIDSFVVFDNSGVDVLGRVTIIDAD